ncbi:MAG: 23S rRNA (guanosine(2251)-2'-O)-methyltransferase RlmB [Acidimicrobiia bacterium]
MTGRRQPGSQSGGGRGRGRSSSQGAAGGRGRSSGGRPSGGGSSAGGAAAGRASGGRAAGGRAAGGRAAGGRASDGRASGGRASGGRASGGAAGAAPSGAGRRDRPGRGGRAGTPLHVAAPVAKGLGGDQVEGRQAVRELLIAGTRKVREVWVSAELQGNEIIDDILDLAEDQRVPVQQVSRTKLESEARSEAPQGILAKAAPLQEVSLESLIRRRGGRAPFLVAVDGVTDPGNLGALLRSAEGAGVDGVVLPRHRAVHVTPTVAKAAAGAIEHVPMAIVGGLPAALESMRKAGVWVVGLDDAADRTLFELGDLAREAICLVLGAEGTGLSRLVRERCDMIVSIPMRGRLSSLNVSVSAALACYEVTRQRSSPVEEA